MQEKLLTLMEGMEKEARTMMGERSYRVADDLFSGVLRIAKYVEIMYLRETDRVLISNVFLQRALCALKLVSTWFIFSLKVSLVEVEQSVKVATDMMFSDFIFFASAYQGQSSP